VGGGGAAAAGGGAAEPAFLISRVEPFARLIEKVPPVLTGRSTRICR
jgi:hypothetical protein